MAQCMEIYSVLQLERCNGLSSTTFKLLRNGVWIDCTCDSQSDKTIQMLVQIVITTLQKMKQIHESLNGTECIQLKRQAQRAAKTRKRKAMSFKAFRARKEAETERQSTVTIQTK